MADPLSVKCPDCEMPPATGCRFSGDYDPEAYHPGRRRLADLRALEHGLCSLCGAFMVRGSVEGSPVDAWHPDDNVAANCPRLPDPTTDWNAYATAINLGLTPGHPGLEHFVPVPPVAEDRSVLTVVAVQCPDCRDGKHGVCTGEGWDMVNDRLAPCDCAATASHREAVAQAAL